MRAMMQTQVKPAAKLSFTPVRPGLLQRKCVCGSTSGCEECRKKREPPGHLQTKLAVGQPGDAFDREADRAAEAVMSGRAASALSPITGYETPQARDAGTAPPIVEDVLNSAGQPLDAVTRETMEQRFGYDFSRVRVHTDDKSADSAQEVNALAYTVGRDIVFDAGQYSPGTTSGQQLLAHELVHVIQQGASSPESASGSGLRLQKQEDAAPPKTWYMLKPPPAVKQSGNTCWAGALSSWLRAMSMEKKTVTDLVFEYQGPTACLAADNSLPPNHAAEVFAEWGVAFMHYVGKQPPPGRSRVLAYDAVKSKLETHGHLLLVEGGIVFDHVSVIYGVGINDKGQPDPNFISVMDPLRGTYINRTLSSLSYPIAIGTFAGRKRPAGCRSQRPPEVKEGSTPD